MENSTSMTMIESTKKLLHVTFNLGKATHISKHLGTAQNGKSIVLVPAVAIEIFYINTCGSENFKPGLDASPVRSCSIYSNTRYKLQDILDVINPSSFITFG